MIQLEFWKLSSDREEDRVEGGQAKGRKSGQEATAESGERPGLCPMVPAPTH
jgi:hypothetical protein